MNTEVKTELSAGLGLRIVCYPEIEGVPSRSKGIRDNGGFLLLFPTVGKYEGQDDRYNQEVFEQNNLAQFLLSALQNA